MRVININYTMMQLLQRFTRAEIETESVLCCIGDYWAGASAGEYDCSYRVGKLSFYKDSAAFENYHVNFEWEESFGLHSIAIGNVDLVLLGEVNT